MLALVKCLSCCFSHIFKSGNADIAHSGSSTACAKFFSLKVAVVEAVQEEVKHIWHNSLSALALKKLNKMIICLWKELY